MMEFKSGDIVKRKNKIGDFIGLVKHTRRYKGRQLAFVHFTGNRRISKVPEHELKIITPIEALNTIGNHKSPFGIGA